MPHRSQPSPKIADIGRRYEGKELPRSPDPHDRDSESRDRPVVDQDRSGSPNPRAERRELPMDDRATKRTERVPTPVMK